MSDRFSEAVEWLTEELKGVVVDGELDFPEITFADAVAHAARLLRKTNQAGLDYFEIDGPTGEILTSFATQHYQFFDLCCDICAKNILAERPLPEPLRLYSYSVLKGRAKRPTPSHRERNKDWLEKQFLYCLAVDVNEMFNLSKTRNKYSTQDSSAHAVSAALKGLGVYGYKPSFITGLLSGEKSQNLRNEIQAFEALLEIGSQTVPLNALHPDYEPSRVRRAIGIQDLVSDALVPAAEKR